VSDEQDISANLGNSPPVGSGGRVRICVPGGRAEADAESNDKNKQRKAQAVTVQVEIGGRNGPDPTRFGDWEIKGRCIDF
jgi:hypothetical protein